MRERKYYVKAGNMYFSYFDGTDAVFVVDDQPGAKGGAWKLTKSEADNLANELGIEIEPVEE